MTLRTLAYGPSPFDPTIGTIVEVRLARRWAAMANATTIGEFVAAHGQCSWTQYVESSYDDVSPADPFNFEEWLTEHTGDSPQTLAFDIAAATISAIIDERPGDFDGVTLGGASPAGHSDSISGPMDQLSRLSDAIGVSRYGFILERDDAVVAAGTAAHLFE